MSTVIDFHSHILPGLDDGSESLAESIAMLQEETAQGIQKVIATPHFYPNHDTPEHFLKKRALAEMRLREEMAQHTGLPEVLVGAEIYFFSGISESELLSELTIAQKKCILLEMPQAPWTQSMYQELEAIYLKRNIIPVIAHVDRYIRPFKTHKIPERLADLPVLVQANAGFFLQRRTSAMALKLLREEKIQLLGSDCHNLDSRRPNLGDALQVIEKHLGKAAIVRINRCEEDLLQDEQP